MRTFYINEHKTDPPIKIRVCLDCRKIYDKRHWFTPHIPTYVDGSDLITECFDTEQELYQYLKDETKDIFIMCTDGYGDIIDVSKKSKFWWVRGHVNSKEDFLHILPNWKDVVKELYGDL